MDLKAMLARWAAASVLLSVGPSWAMAQAAVEPTALQALQEAYARAVPPGDDAQRYQALLARVLQRLQRSSAAAVDVDAVARDATRTLESLPPAAGDPAQVFKSTMNAAAASLRNLDPHFRYLDARSYGNDRQDTLGSFVGLGLQLESSDGAVRIVSLIPDSPAERASALVPGDLIVRVDGEPLAGMPLADAIARMRGAPGSPVSITVQRSGQEAEITVALKRDTIRRQILRASMQGDVLVLRLSAFGQAVSAALEQAVAQAAAVPKAVVLDLRGNPGGLLAEAVKVADAFLNAGEIVSLRRAESTLSRSWNSDPVELLPGVPMVVLMDGRSASASELVADALQHHGRATVMGTRSYGKGSVQTTLSLGPDAGAIKLTTALYHGPSGRTLHRIGVAPDIELLAAPAAADAPPAPRQPRVRVDPARCGDTADADRGLACAIEYLNAGGVDAFVSRLGGVPTPNP